MHTRCFDKQSWAAEKFIKRCCFYNEFMSCVSGVSLMRNGGGGMRGRLGRDRTSMEDLEDLQGSVKMSTLLCKFKSECWMMSST